MFVKKYLKTEPASFVLACAVAALSLVLSVAYPSMYGSTDEYTVWVTVFAVAAFVASTVLTLFAQSKWIGACQLVLLLAGFGFFVYSVYYYVSVVLVGIDADSFSFEFIFTTAAFLAEIVASAVNVFVGGKEAQQ